VSSIPPARDSSTAIAALLFGGLLALLLAPLPLLLFVVAETSRGRLFALSALALALCPLTAALAWRHARKAWWLTAGALFTIWACTGAWLAATAPSGDASHATRVFHLYAGSPAQFSRHALGNLLPETDQLMLGFTVMPAVDALLTQSQAARLKVATAKVYTELEEDPGFRSLGSTLPLAYAELRGSPAKALHSLVYIPADLDRTKPAPVMVFFHGSGGNLKGYLWVLSKVADRLGFVLIAPSFGLGNWQTAETNQRLDTALAELAQVLPINERQVHVLGLSNGGLAVSEVFAYSQTRVKSFAFISPVFDEAALKSLSTASRSGRPVLVLSGLLDDRVPIDYVRSNAARLRQTGAQVELSVVESADHFLIFSHRDPLLANLSRWLDAASRVPETP
jgi:pimeloyl-ACP methyl ester carboxylesterase